MNTTDDIADLSNWVFIPGSAAFWPLGGRYLFSKIEVTLETDDTFSVTADHVHDSQHVGLTIPCGVFRRILKELDE